MFCHFFIVISRRELLEKHIETIVFSFALRDIKRRNLSVDLPYLNFPNRLKAFVHICGSKCWFHAKIGYSWFFL